MEINCWVFDSQKECVSIPGKWQLSPQQHSGRLVQDHSATNQQECWVLSVSTTCVSLVSKWAERRLDPSKFQRVCQLFRFDANSFRVAHVSIHGKTPHEMCVI